jgi:hypothetical protein
MAEACVRAGSRENGQTGDHRGDIARKLLVTGGLIVVSACAGNGDGLDENGRPQGEGPPPLVAEFESIQENVLTPICTACHAGAGAPLGLRLDAESSYAMLVNAPSAEVPGLLRVSPGDPDGSYLIQKLEGTAAVGDRMPLDQPALPQATIDVIRQWIAEGAQPPAEAAMTTDAVKLAAVDPLPGAVLATPPTWLVIAADGPLNTSRMDAGTVRLERSGGDGRFGDELDTAPGSFVVEVRSVSPTVVALRPRFADWPDDTYRVVISGAGPDAVDDLAARPIDGDGDGVPGGDFTLEFKLEKRQ